MTPRPRPLRPEDYATAGRALYGERWISELAAALGVNDRNLRYWLAGRSGPRDPGDVRARLLALLGERGDAVRVARARLLADSRTARHRFKRRHHPTPRRLDRDAARA